MLICHLRSARFAISARWPFYDRAASWTAALSPYSSVVEHPLSKRKVGSSILPGGSYLAFAYRATELCAVRELEMRYLHRLCLYQYLLARVDIAFVSAPYASPAVRSAPSDVVCHICAGSTVRLVLCLCCGFELVGCRSVNASWVRYYHPIDYVAAIFGTAN